MARKNKKICILQVDDHYLHAVLFQDTENGLVVDKEICQPGRWSQEDGSLAEALKALVESNDLATTEVYSVLPRHEIASRFLVFPTHEEAELASMVRFSASEYVPFPEHELHITQCFVSKEADGESRALAVYAQKDTIKKHLALLRQAGIVPAGIYLGTSCLAAAVDVANIKEERFALMNLAPGGIEVLVFDKGRLFFGRAIADAHAWNPDEPITEEHIQELSLELRSSLSAYRRETEHGETAETVYLCSDVVNPSTICAPLGLEVGKECYPAQFAGGIVQGAEKLGNPLQLTALGAAHLALGHKAYKINLLPQDLLRVRKMKGLQQSALRVGAVAALFVVALLGLFAQAVYQRSTMIDALEVQASSIAPMAEGVASKQRQLAILRQQVEGSGNVLEAMWAVTQAAPQGKMTIVQFAYDGETGIDVFGQAFSLDAIALFASNLRTMAEGQLDYFRNAKSLYENRGQLYGKEIYNFQITIPTKADDAN